ncbi:MAG: site-specific integrase [Candidatus ainarchaeum sp.]|nr:site-specific integrase [Candidatus ainarchaeum sp.]
MDNSEIDWVKEANRTSWCNEDKEVFLKYVKDAQIQTGGKSIGDTRITKYHICFGTIQRATGTTISQSIESLETLREAILAIEHSRYMPATKKDTIKLLGSVYNFIKSNERSLVYADKELRKLLSYQPKSNERQASKPIITREELREIAKFGSTLDKAILYLLFESGMRIGEFVSIKKANLTFAAEGLDVFVPDGKTGQRRIIVVEAASFVARWLEEHPIKANDEFLWVSPETKRPFAEAGIKRRIEVVVDKMNNYRKKQGIPLFTKPINPHNFRHSRASELGAEPGMTEQILCKYFGWEIGSDMPKTYLHLSDEKVRRAVLRTYGAVKEEDKAIITHKTCQRCKEENPLALNYCGRCGTDLNSGRVISNIEELKDRVIKLESLLLNKRLISTLRDSYGTPIHVTQ